ncbi:HTH-type transcriptional regulator SrpS [Labrenzia sp. THAF82]|uniref:IclR family transcriptional regulator n=1 Tax=Labrenzia sp. THAF82 TaxID=2587861 RepID=UPI001267B562|nr:IclR family transcriptional regulator [Labrenzia sp. THAF82]QFT30930.1 HTH-type transcriptional regulator SrpS [Labrenzia sp. THAF82]
MNIERKAQSNQGVQVISRAAEILRILKKDNSGLSLGGIAERVHLPRSTVQRIVNALIAERLVMASSAEGGLRLGPEIQSLAAAGRINMAELIRPVLVDLSSKTEETVDLAAFREDHMVFVDQVIGSHRLRTVSAVGEVFPMTTTANGKAALSLFEDDALVAIATPELKATEDDTKPLSEFMREIEDIRQTGIGWDLNEHTDGISAAGFAFKDPMDQIYAVSIPVPSHRFTRLKGALAELLLQARKSILQLL